MRISKNLVFGLGMAGFVLGVWNPSVHAGELSSLHKTVERNSDSRHLVWVNLPVQCFDPRTGETTRHMDKKMPYKRLTEHSGWKGQGIFRHRVKIWKYDTKYKEVNEIHVQVVFPREAVLQGAEIEQVTAFLEGTESHPHVNLEVVGPFQYEEVSQQYNHHDEIMVTLKLKQ